MTVTLYAAVCGILLVILSLRVALLRMRLRVGLGTGGEQILERAVRVHGNFVEYVPMALLLIALCEMQGAASYFIHGAGSALVIARLAHFQGVRSSSGTSPGRFGGILLTWLVILVTSGLLIWNLLVK